MVKRAREIETEIISRFSKGRHGSGCRVSVTYRKDFRKHILMLFARNHVEPDTENVRVLAIMFLCGRTCQQAIVPIPAELVDCLRSALRGSAIEPDPDLVAQCEFHISRIA